MKFDTVCKSGHVLNNDCSTINNNKMLDINEVQFNI